MSTISRIATPMALVLATVLAAAPSVVGRVHSIEQPPSGFVSATLFRDIARRENPVVVSITTRSRVRDLVEGDAEVSRFFELLPPDLRSRIHVAAGSGFLISSTGDILTNSHLVARAERIDVTLFGNERKRYRAVRIGSDALSDCALIRLQSPPLDLQTATLGDSSELKPGDWVLAIGNPFQLAHSVTVGVVSFPQRPIEVREGRWQDMIQTDASINMGHSGGPLFDARGRVVGINVAMLDGDNGGSIGIGFAVPIDTVKALLPQLRAGKVVRGQLGVQLQGGPILEDEATELRLPNASGAIVMLVDAGSAAEHAGLRAGDVIVEIDGKPVVDTRDLIARTAVMTPGTRVTVKFFRDGKEQTRTATIEELPLDEVEEAPADDADDSDGLTLGEITPSANRLGVGAAVRGAVVVEVAPDSPADDAELEVGDIICAINNRRVDGRADTTRALHLIQSGRPIFLLVWRRGTEVFLRMRRN